MSVVVLGGGLVGALLAVYLRDRGFPVVVYEKRWDLRHATAETGRSINLILTSRGLYALRQVGLEKAALALAVPVRGRMMHPVQGTTAFQPYGISDAEVNYSVSRTALNAMLIGEAERRGAKFFFEHETLDLDLASMKVTVRDTPSGITKVADGLVFIGTDGVASPTRGAIVEHLQLNGVAANFVAERLGISYKEVTFPAGPNGDYVFDGRALHIWPRGPHFLMALADLKNTFTGTLYLPDGSVPLNIPGGDELPAFEEMQNDPEVTKAYIAKHYPDVPAIVPDIVEQMARPHGLLATVRLSHWHFKGRALVIGDAAHGIVPFFGQGMNLGFESVLLLDRFIGARNVPLRKVPWERVFAKLAKHHQHSATAIADMAIENFTEMSFKVGQQAFLKRKAIENSIESKFPQRLRSRYWMVTRSLVPYADVKACGDCIDRVIDAVIAAQPAAAEGLQLDDSKVLELIERHLTPFLVERGIELSQPLKSYYPAAPHAKSSM